MKLKKYINNGLDGRDLRELFVWSFQILSYKKTGGRFRNSSNILFDFKKIFRTIFIKHAYTEVDQCVNRSF